jgi:Cu-Zn family superoxide dismutase
MPGIRALLIVLAAASPVMAGRAFALGEKAIADIKDKSGAAVGRAEFIEVSGGVLVKLDLEGLPPGPHAVRIHDAGKCEGDFASAGEIYNPEGAKHGYLHDEGPMPGDFPNIHAGARGEVRAELLNHLVSLGKDAEVPLLDGDGAAIVVTASGSDYFSEPDGNAGPRIACGVITPGP